MLKLIIFTILTVTLSAAELSKDELDKIVTAIYRIEGKEKTIHPYGIRSVKPRDKSHARIICERTVKNAFIDWQLETNRGCYFNYLGNRYAPINDPRDKRGLNKNWVPNIKSILGKEFVSQINRK